MGKGHCEEIDRRVFSTGKTWLLRVAECVAKNGIDIGSAPPCAEILRQPYRLVHGGALGYAIQMSNLVQTDSQRAEHPRVETFESSFAMMSQDEVEPVPPPQDSVDDLVCEISIGRGETVMTGVVQQRGRIRTSPFESLEDFECRSS